ncbi:hypothetical protein [Streptomyces sp. NPDC056049]
MFSARCADDRAMRLAARLGFAEVKLFEFEEYGAEQWFGVCPPAATGG